MKPFYNKRIYVEMILNTEYIRGSAKQIKLTAVLTEYWMKCGEKDKNKEAMVCSNNYFRQRYSKLPTQKS